MAPAAKRVIMKAALAGIALLVASCGSGTHGSGPNGEPATLPAAADSPGALSLGETSNSLVLPLTAYYPGSQQVANIQTVRFALLSRCLQQVGFSYPDVITEPVQYGGDPGRGQFYDFGVTSTSFAAHYGYHDTSVTKPMRTASGGPIPQQGALSAAENAAAAKCATQIDGQTGYLNSNWNILVQTLGIEAWQRANTDPRTLAAFKSWSSCMQAKGFDYSTPLRSLAGQLGNSDAAKGWLTAAPSRLEIQTATADVACKAQTGLLKTWIGVLAAYQKALLPANVTQLRANLADFQTILSKEQQLLAKGQ